MTEKEKNYYLDIFNKIADNGYKVGFGDKLDDLLTRLVKYLRDVLYYERAGRVYNSTVHIQFHNSVKASYLHDLMLLFKRIKNDGLESELPAAVDLYSAIADQKDLIPYDLESYFYPQDAYLKSKRYYYGVWYDLIANFREDFLLKMHLSLYKNIKPNIKQLLQVYSKYTSEIMCTLDNWRQRSMYATIMELILPYFYKEGYDLNLFPKVVDYVFNHSLELETYYILNSGDENKEVDCKKIKDYDSVIMARIMEGIKGNNRIIR